MTEHELKMWPEPFAAVRAGVKRHEIRKQDRPYAIGDVLVLKEYDPGSGRLMPGELPEPRGYTGREMRAKVTFITHGGTWGLPHGLCVMSIEMLTTTGERR
jgi:hypothetical protein